MSCCPPGSFGYLAADHKDEGQVQSRDGVQYYQVGKGKTGLLICPDVWGWNGGRTRAVADNFAKRGLNVFVGAVLAPFEGGTDGDGFPPNFNIAERMSELQPLIKGEWHAEKTLPKYLKVIDAMKEAGVERLGVLGFCYGAWVGMKLCAEVKEIVCGVAPHPSVHLEGMIGGDPVKVAEACKCPWAFFPCGKVGGQGADPAIYDAEGELFQAMEKTFPGKNLTKRYESVFHGFAVRGDIKDGDMRAAVQEVFFDSARFLSSFGVGHQLKILGISGSLRKASTNSGLVRCAAALADDLGVQFTIADISGLPLYNQDLDGEDAPEAVKAFKAQVKESDAFLFGCPEYNYNITPALKNALDWCSKHPENAWKGKAAGIVGAGGGFGTNRAQMSLRQSGVFLDIHFINSPEVCIKRFEEKCFDDATGDVQSDKIQGRVKDMLERVVTLAKKLNVKV